VTPIRRLLGFPTIFNLLGPVGTPARPEIMIVGVAREEIGETFRIILSQLGVKKGWVVWGCEGLDEISPEGETKVWDISKPSSPPFLITPDLFGIPRHSLSLVGSGTPDENSKLLISLLSNELDENHPILDFVLLNAAALIFVSGAAKTEKEATELAKKSVKDGGGLKALQTLIDVAQEEIKRVSANRSVDSV
jgi:anthranilate phosphoribosyltransferase